MEYNQIMSLSGTCALPASSGNSCVIKEPYRCSCILNEPAFKISVNMNEASQNKILSRAKMTDPINSIKKSEINK